MAVFNASLWRALRPSLPKRRQLQVGASKGHQRLPAQNVHPQGASGSDRGVRGRF